MTNILIRQASDITNTLDVAALNTLPHPGDLVQGESSRWYKVCYVIHQTPHDMQEPRISAVCEEMTPLDI
jgi:hypothetical protein